MRRRCRSILVLAFALALPLALTALPVAAQMPQGQGGSPLSGENSAAKKAAKQAAEEWLSLTDSGEFGKSYDAAGSRMQEQIPKNKWQKAGAAMQQKLGSLQNRQLVQAQYRESIPARKDTLTGEFVILGYMSKFESGRVIEQMLLEKEQNQWKVAGYSPRRPRPQGGRGGRGGGPGGGPGGGGPGGGSGGPGGGR
jgi:hypothetical protein